MFLRSLQQTNRKFLDAAVSLHQSGEIPANSYVLDLDAIAENAKAIIGKAKAHGLTVYPMTKQFGRNPPALQVLVDSGADGFVAVDMACARAIRNGGFRLGHVGHLVQVPRHEIEEALEMAPDYWTVFGREQAAAISERLNGRTQRILLRIYDLDDVVVPTHAGGFQLADIDADLEYLSGLPGLQIAGLTTYPSAVVDRLERRVVATSNVKTMSRAAERLRARGIADVQLNFASELATATVDDAVADGATQIEPGHAFTGTSPIQAFTDVPERQAIIYLSEVSHYEGNGAFFFGGGLYECIGAVEHTPEAVTGRVEGQQAILQVANLTTPPNGVIDFYGRLDYPRGTDVKVGDTVITCTRPQAFFTRAFIVPVKGIHSGEPEALGVWDVAGNRTPGTPAHADRKHRRNNGA